MSEKKSVIEAFGGWLGIALLLVGFAAVITYDRWQTQGSGKAMQAVAAELGLKVTGVGKRFQMRGRVDGVGVAVDTTTELFAGDVSYYTSFKLYAPDGPPGRIVGVSVRQRAIDRWTGEQRVLTGDQTFDDGVFVSGDPAEMLAFLNAEAREAILPAATAGWSFESATWSAIEAGRITDPEHLRSLLTLGLNAMRVSRSKNDVSTPLQDQTARDPHSRVRAAAAPETSEAVATHPAFGSEAEALAALDDIGADSAFAAALFLADQGDGREAVRMALVGMLVDSQRQARAIAALAKVGNRLDIAVLSVVKGEHEAAAKAAAATIHARLR